MTKVRAVCKKLNSEHPEFYESIKLMDWLKVILESKDKILPKFIIFGFLTGCKTICVMSTCKFRICVDR